MVGASFFLAVPTQFIQSATMTVGISNADLHNTKEKPIEWTRDDPASMQTTT